MPRFLVFVILSLLLFVQACTTPGTKYGTYKLGDPYKVEGQLYVPKLQTDYDEIGLASWYGSNFHGKATANGASYDMNSLTAAHKTLPLPCMVRVTNLDNNRSLIVMVNDRGPFSKGRLIDVSKRAAEILGFKDKGTTKVRVQYLPGQTARLLADLPNPPKEAIAINKDSMLKDMKYSDNSQPNNSSTVSAQPGFFARIFWQKCQLTY